MTAPVKYGLLFFLVSSGISIVEYFINKDLLFHPSLSMVLSIALPILFIILSIKADRADEPGYTLAEGLKAGMITYAIGTFLSTIFIYILANMIDPTLNDLAIEFAREIATKTAEAMSGFMGVDEAMQAEMMEEMSKQEIKSPFSLSSLGLGWVIGLIFPGIIISLIAAAILKKN